MILDCVCQRTESDEIPFKLSKSELRLLCAASNEFFSFSAMNKKEKWSQTQVRAPYSSATMVKVP